MTRLKYQSDEALAPGLYPVRVTKIEETVGQFGPQLQVDFEVDGGEHDGRQLRSWASAKLTSRSKLGNWVRALLGLEMFPPGYELDTDALVGKTATAAVDKVTRTDGEIGNRITALYAIGQGAQQQLALGEARANGEDGLAF